MNKVIFGRQLKNVCLFFVGVFTFVIDFFFFFCFFVEEYKKFWEIYPKLSKSVDEIKYLPVRVIGVNGLTLMRPFPSKSESGELLLLKDILTSFPDYNETKQAVVHGVVPPLDTPVSWLAYHCAHADNFLYIVLVKKNA